MQKRLARDKFLPGRVYLKLAAQPNPMRRLRIFGKVKDKRFATARHAERKTAPGFMMPLGSSADLIARIAASFTGSP